MVILCLTFWRTATLFSKVCAFPPTLYEGSNFTFLPTLIMSFFIIAILVGVKRISWFWFAFPRRLMMLSTYSCIYRPFVYFLWTMSVHNFLIHFKNWIIFLCYWVIGVLYIFWIQGLYQIHDLQKFSTGCFTSTMVEAQVFNFDEMQFILCALCSWCHI